MQTRRSVVLILAMAGLLATSVLFASVALAQTTAPAGHSTIHGRAIYQDTERPVRRAPVVLVSEEGRAQSPMTVTDGQVNLQ